MTHTVVIVQARTGSTRLPGKVLMDVSGEPVLTRVIRRAQLIHGSDEVAVATSARAEDAAIVDLANSLGIRCYGGSDVDVLDRYYQAARALEADVVVRVTADCPMLDPGLSGQVLDLFRSNNADYASNVHPRSFPDGLDTEVVTRQALERAWREARALSDREHVTGYIWPNPGQFRIVNLMNDLDLSQLRWTVDYPEDLEFVRAVYRHLGSAESPGFGMHEVLELLDRNPDLSNLNSRWAA